MGRGGVVISDSVTLTNYGSLVLNDASTLTTTDNLINLGRIYLESAEARHPDRR